jgi:hypothetical protein
LNLLFLFVDKMKKEKTQKYEKKGKPRDAGPRRCASAGRKSGGQVSRFRLRLNRNEGRRDAI